MFHLVNAAVMPAGDGQYTSRTIGEDVFALLAHEADTRGELNSAIGYPETAEILSDLCGFQIPLNRDEAIVTDGDTLLVAKLKRRLTDPNTKGDIQPKISDFEFRLVSYTLTETRKTGNVFLVRCCKTGKDYVGQTTAHYISDAWSNIRGEAKGTRESGRPLIKAIRKYGEAHFKIEPLHADIPIAYLDLLRIAEIKKHNTLHPNGYNLEGGGYRKGYKERAEFRPETREKLSQKASERKLTPKTREKLAVLATGRKHTSETKEKMRRARIGRKHSAEARRKMREAHAKRRQNAGEDNGKP